ncbi:MAG: hypothetical protein ACLPVF_10875 [Acidimicrobiales bacterium]
MPVDSSAENGESDAARPTLWMRFQNAVVKPDSAPKKDKAPDDRTLEEIDAQIKRADDKERAIGLVAAPLAGGIAIIISGSLINHAVATHQSTTAYYELMWVLVLMSVLMLGLAWFRKRLPLGIVMALFGLSIFNLKFWGFGVPFVMVGAWYLVRAYRLHQARKAAGGESASYRPGSANAPRAALPRPNKRYTPPTAPVKRPAKPKPEQKAG